MKISVIVPCYNYGRFLEDCINSLIGGDTSLGFMPGQTATDWECIIVDDSSSDNTGEIAKSLQKRDERIRYTKTKSRQGTAGAFNQGIEQAQGTFIMQLSADDMLEPWALEVYLKAQENNPHSFVYGNQQIFAFGRRLRYFFKDEQRFDFEANLVENHIPASMMYPRQAWVDIGGIPDMPDGREDWATGVALSLWGYCGVYLHRSGYLYRRENHNRSKRNQVDNRAFALRMTQLFPRIYEEGYTPMLVQR